MPQKPFLHTLSITGCDLAGPNTDQHQQPGRTNEILRRRENHKNSHRYEGELRLIEMLLAEAQAPP